MYFIVDTSGKRYNTMPIPSWGDAIDIARPMALAFHETLSLEEAHHGSYVPVDWCERCTPDHNCQSMTAEEEMALDFANEGW